MTAIVSVDKMSWPDACLGVVHMGMFCKQTATSGYKIVLGANGQQYEYHTDETGNNIQLATK